MYYFNVIILYYREMMGYYKEDLDKDLFNYCLKHGKKNFLKKAMIIHAFENHIFKDEDVIYFIINLMYEGQRNNFLLNVLVLMDISAWKNKFIKSLIDIIAQYVEENYEKNRLLVSYNPLMSIALSAELLTNISSSRKKFENECKRV